MKNKKIVIFGADGMLGRYCSRYFRLKNYKVIALTRDDTDLTHSDMAMNLLRLLQSKEVGRDSIVINCAGIIKQRNIDRVRLIQVNSLFPHILHRLSEHMHFKNVQISTDCVFSGEEGYYTESYPPNAIDDYGRSKIMGENENSSIFRTSIIGEEIFNRLSFLEWAKSNKNMKVKGYAGHFWNGVTCLQLAKHLEEKIRKNHLHKGVRHYFTNNGDEHRFAGKSKDELLETISKVYDLNLKITKDYKTCIDRRLHTNYKLFETPSIEEQLVELKEFKLI